MISSKQILLAYTFPNYRISWEVTGSVQNWTFASAYFKGFYHFTCALIYLVCGWFPEFPNLFVARGVSRSQAEPRVIREGSLPRVFILSPISSVLFLSYTFCLHQEVCTTFRPIKYFFGIGWKVIELSYLT